MAGITVPSDKRVGPGGPFFGDGWSKMFSAVARKLNAGAAVGTVTTADATDLTTAVALVNELKAKINSLIEAQNA